MQDGGRQGRSPKVPGKGREDQDRGLGEWRVKATPPPRHGGRNPSRSPLRRIKRSKTEESRPSDEGTEGGGGQGDFTLGATFGVAAGGA